MRAKAEASEMASQRSPIPEIYDMRDAMVAFDD